MDDIKLIIEVEKDRERKRERGGVMKTIIIYPRAPQQQAEKAESRADRHGEMRVPCEQSSTL